MSALGRLAPRVLLAVAVTLTVLIAGPAKADAKRPLELGVFDGLFRSADPGERGQWLATSADRGSELALTVIAWSSVAPADRGPGFDPTDPADPRYDWGTIDGFVVDAEARGLEPILTVTSAPRWAEGGNRPSGADPGTWKPRAKELRKFAVALASRYSGSFVPPGGGGPLPKVRDYQAWTEPNLPNHLSPQWQGKRAASPSIYRKLLNGFFAGVKSVSKRNRVITAGTAPYGDDPGGTRVRPLRFWRDVFCLRGRKALKPTQCAAKPRLDVLAHHPINTSGPPRQSAIDPDDISSPDLGALHRVLRAAERTGHIKPGGRHPLWVTEFWWESNPPTRGGWSPARQARNIEESLYLFWKAGATVAVTLKIRDGDKGTPEAGTGLYFRDGKAKPAARAFRFPFVADRKGKRLRIWGKAPRRGRVVIESRRGKGWRRVGAARAGRTQIFTGKIKRRGNHRLRASIGGERSLVWRVK